jgi:hydrogenase maturation protease
MELPSERPNRPQTEPFCQLLVIGYGNTLRSDDGVGPRVAEAVAAWRQPGIRALVCHQLSPEHAADLARAAQVVFVDAAVGGPQEVRLRELSPGATTQLMAHAADPRTVLALARDVFGHTPRAWWLTIPVARLEFGEELSPPARAGLERALELLRALCPRAN